VSPIVSAAITHAVSEVYLSRSATYGESIRTGLRLFTRLVGTAILMTLLILVGLVLLIIPGLYLMFVFMLAYTVIVLEDRGGWESLKRSRELARDNVWRIVAVYLVSFVLMTVMSLVLSLVTRHIPVAGTLIDAVVQAVFTAYMSAALVVLYFDIRCRKEAFDLEHLAGLVDAGAVAPTPG
jgi:hypothetical protein